MENTETNNPLNSDELLSRKEAAKLLKITLSTLWSWTNSGKLKSYGIANRVYYKRNEILTSSLKPLIKKGSGQNS